VKKLIIVFLLVICGILSAEIRSIWVLPWNIKSPYAIDNVIENALAANQNELLIEVRYRSDALYIPNRLSDIYPNPDPRSYILSGAAFDPLEYTLRKAHDAGLRVQAWVVVFNATHIDPEINRRNYIFKNHPNWITEDKYGNKMNGKEQYGYFIDPGIPEVQDYLLDVFSDLVDSYPNLDGLHLDYARYPSIAYGYHPTSLERYEAAQKKQKLSFAQWRIQQVTEFVEKLNQRVKSLNPNLILSAAVFSEINEARTHYGQDWFDWLNRGLIDYAYPMTYHPKYDAFKRQLGAMLDNGNTDRVVVGLRAWNAQGGSLLPENSPNYNIQHIRDRIDYIRQHDFAGITLFSYEGIMTGGALQLLAKGAYPYPVPLPYISDPIAELRALAAQDSQDKLAFYKAKSGYTLECVLPLAGDWHWDLLNQAGEKLFQSSKYYHEGFNSDDFLGAMARNSLLPQGSYTLQMYLPERDEVYRIPIIIEGSPFERTE